VTNWAAYDSALRQRGSLTVWFTEAAIEAWKAEPRGTRGGQPRYSAVAITTALTLRAVFRLALRQTEGLVASMPSATAETAPTKRDRQLQLIAERGRRGWQRASGYNWRALVEADIGRYKRVIGDALRSRIKRRQTTEVAIAVASPNGMLELGRPEYARLP
jgi:hypothetical protein